MSLSIGIVGLPNVGKSTLFNALLKRQAALAANYPFATIEPNIGIVDVPDLRLKKLAELVKTEFGRSSSHKTIPEKILPAVVKFYDIAGLVKGASKGEGLGNQFLSHIREVDAIAHVVRNFEDQDVIRAGSVNPEEDISTINTELILADLQVLEKKIAAHESELRKSRSQENLKKQEIYLKLKEFFDKGVLPVFEEQEDKDLLKDLNLLTLKPQLLVYNVSESDLKDYENKNNENPYNIYLSAKIESELSSFSEEEKLEFMKEMGIDKSGLDLVIQRGFEILGLQTFLTAGPKEVRAWTIKKGFTAPQAAGAIHTDFERGFISAEIISFNKLVEAGGFKQAKDKGYMRIEGKNYTMQDGDVVEFRFSV